MKSKYIAFGTDLVDAAVVFPEVIGHDEMLAMVRSSYSCCELFGAGFVYVGLDGDVRVYGKSISLGTESRDEDIKLVKQAIGWN